MAAELITAGIVDDHAAVVAGVRYRCERADPPIRLVDAGARLADVWTGPHADHATAIKCVDLGALAYLTKREGPERLAPAIRAAARGLPYTAPPLSGTDDAPGKPRLSPREVEVLRAYARVGRTKSDLVTRALDDGVITLTELNQAAL